jgi:hypothetical protein
MGDVVVLLPGIMGSVLQKGGRDVWALSGSALLSGIRSLGQSIQDLTLSGDSSEADTLGDGIAASRIFPDAHLLPGFWKIDGYSTTVKALTDEFDLQTGRNYFEFPYDWRRDNRAAARRLSRMAPAWLRTWRERSGNREAKLILIAHSMGGLVSRYFLEALGGWRDTRMLITFGTPYRGSLNALNMLANGMSASLGPFRLVDLARLVRSFTSVYQLLPIYPCVNDGNGRLQRLTDAVGIPNLDMRRVHAAFDFHEEMKSANEQNARDQAYLAGRYTVHPIVGTYQRTLQTARRSGASLEMSDRHPQANIRGDGTVPQVSATPIEPDVLTKQHRTVFVAEMHGSLQNSAPMLDHVRSLLAAGPVPEHLFREPQTNAVALQVEDIYSTQQPVRVTVSSTDARALAIVVVAEVDSRQEVARAVVEDLGASEPSVDCGRLPEGVYRVRVMLSTGGSATDVFVVARP